MKYEAPIFEKTEIEAKDVLTVSGDIEVKETSESSVDFLINFSKLFG